MANDGALKSSHQGKVIFAHLAGGRNNYKKYIFVEGKQTVQKGDRPKQRSHAIHSCPPAHLPVARTCHIPRPPSPSTRSTTRRCFGRASGGGEGSGDDRTDSGSEDEADVTREIEDDVSAEDVADDASTEDIADAVARAPSGENIAATESEGAVRGGGAPGAAERRGPLPAGEGARDGGAGRDPRANAGGAPPSGSRADSAAPATEDDAGDGTKAAEQKHPDDAFPPAEAFPVGGAARNRRDAPPRAAILEGCDGDEGGGDDDRGAPGPDGDAGTVATARTAATRVPRPVATVRAAAARREAAAAVPPDPHLARHAVFYVLDGHFAAPGEGEGRAAPGDGAPRAFGGRSGGASRRLRRRVARPQIPRPVATTWQGHTMPLRRKELEYLARI